MFLGKECSVAAVSGWPCGVFFVSGCSLMVRSFSVLLLLLVAAAAYDICFLLEDGMYFVNSFLIKLL